MIESCALAGWAHDPCAEANVPCKVANTASEAWRFKNLERKTDGNDALRLAAWCPMRGKGASGAYLRRQRGRLGAPEAITATAHKMARIVYRLMRFGEAYVKRTEQQYAEGVRQRQEKQLARRAREMGYELKKVEAPPAEAAPPGG